MGRAKTAKKEVFESLMLNYAKDEIEKKAISKISVKLFQKSEYGPHYFYQISETRSLAIYTFPDSAYSDLEMCRDEYAHNFVDERPDQTISFLFFNDSGWLWLEEVYGDNNIDERGNDLNGLEEIFEKYFSKVTAEKSLDVDLIERLSQLLNYNDFQVDRWSDFFINYLHYNKEIKIPAINQKKLASVAAKIFGRESFDLELYCVQPKVNSRDVFLFHRIPSNIKKTVSNMRLSYELLREFEKELSLMNLELKLGLCLNSSTLTIMTPHLTRDHRVIVTSDRLRDPYSFASKKVHLIRNENLVEKRRLGSILIDIEQMFKSRELEKEFFKLCREYRIALLNDVLGKKKILKNAIEIYSNELITPPLNLKNEEWKKSLISNPETKIATKAIVDGLMLRIIMHRFIEAYHGVVITPKHQDLLKKYAVKKSGRKSKKQSPNQLCLELSDPFELNSNADKLFKKDFLSLDEKYMSAFGGDIHYAQVARAVRYLEEELSAEYLVELLDITGQDRFSFRYEDLTPEVIENYYQDSLMTDIELTEVRTSKTNVEYQVQGVDSDINRKELGAYFTRSEVSRFALENSLNDYLNSIISHAEMAVVDRNYQKALEYFEKFFSTSVCDPTVGGGSFLKEAFRIFESYYLRLSNIYNGLPSKMQDTCSIDFFNKKNGKISYETFVLTNCLYGVDFDIKALYIASQTLTLESLKFLKEDERFPSFINVNLKPGNTFVSFLEPGEIDSLDVKEIAELVKLRMKIRKKSKQDELDKFFAKELELKRKILAPIIKKRKDEWGDNNVLYLRPFTWEIEFAECFFNEDGSKKEAMGFDFVVGNPPWECLSPIDDEFFYSVDSNWPKGKAAKKTEKEKRKNNLFKENPFLRKHYEVYLDEKNAHSVFLEASRQYTCQSPKFTYVGGGNGDHNTYKLAVEKYLNICNGNGGYAFLTPEGIAGDKGTRDLRIHLLKNRTLSRIVSFNEVNDVFPEATQPFCILIGEHFGKKEDIQYISDLKSYKDLSGIDKNSCKIQYSILEKDTLETRPFISISSEKESKVIEKYYKFNSPYMSNDPWTLKPYRELDTTKHMHLATNRNDGKWKICKGEDMDRFKEPEAQYGLNHTQYKTAKGRRGWEIEIDRVAWRNIAGTNNPRRMVVSIIPAGTACFHSLNVIKGPKNKDQLYYLVGILNSFCYEYFMRKQSKNNNVSIYFITLSPLPRLTSSNTLFREVSKRSKSLHQLKPDSPKRKELEAELEAIVAYIYGFNKTEFECIVDSFDKVDKAYRELVLDKFKEMKNEAKNAA